MTVFFDIESSSLPEDVLLSRQPEFKAPDNYKDPVKIAEYVIQAKAKWIEDAALSPVTGQVLVVGTMADSFRVFEGEEKKLLGDFWEYAQGVLWRGDLLTGFCILHFDLPFLIKRSWSHGVKVPMALLKPGRYWNDQIIDVQERWQLGDRQCGGSLDTVSKFLGGPGKPEGVTGKDFAKLWESDRPKALEYLKNDLEMTRLLYQRMCS